MKAFFLIPIVLLALCRPASADDETAFYPAYNRLVFSASRYNPLGDSVLDHRTGLGIEYRFATVPVLKWFHPWIGFELMGRGAMWFGGGLETDIDLSEHWVLTIQSGPGYMNDGNQHKIANVWPEDGLLFRSRGEIAYKMPSGGRIGLNIGHISNAGLAHNSNPGIESVGVSVQLPIDILGNQ